MATYTIHISDDILAELRAKAAAEGKSVDELAEDAFRQYLEMNQWDLPVAAKREVAGAKGLTAADVPRLIQEVRRDRHYSHH
uniref:CopG domain protein DNA-binding domain protein n=1 Tax=Solibacter usitatus (strain Ellin6076) TaxID=234267 RepID=Q01U74_SOLUE